MKYSRHYSLLSMLLFQLILLTMLSGCQKENQGFDITPENTLDHAFSLTEDEFFSTFNADKDTAQAQVLGDDTIYELSETTAINGHDASISITFSSGQWRGTAFNLIFEGDTHL